MGRPADEVLAQLRALVVEERRDPSTFGLTLGLTLDGGAAEWVEGARQLAQLGATHIGLSAPADLDAAAARQRLVDAVRALRAEFGE